MRRSLRLLLLLVLAQPLFSGLYACEGGAGSHLQGAVPCGAGWLDAMAAEGSGDSARVPASEKDREVAPLTINHLIAALGGYRLFISVWLLIPPLLMLVLPPVGMRPGASPQWLAYLYSTLIYMVMIPGMLSVALLAYALLFVQQNLLQVDVFVYFLPVISMVATLILARRKAVLKRLPGVDGILALGLLLAITFLVLLILLKTRIWVAFVGPLQSLLIFGVVLFFLFRWALRKLTR